MRYLGEFIGMLLLIIFNNGVVANVKLNGSGMKNENSVMQICISSGLAVFIPLCLFSKYSGAHFNPAVTISLAITGQFPVSLVVPYILCQLGGAFLGACIVWLMFRDHFAITDDVDVKRSVFCTSPSIRHTSVNLCSEIIGTFILAFTIVSIGKSGMGNQAGTLIFATVTIIGMSFGGLTGFAINPARDLGPRLAHAILPIKNKRNDWGYSWIPVVGPILGGLIAALLFLILPW